MAGTCAQEFNVLPRQPLTVLRDLLSCPADSYLGTLGMAVPGAYFYIEGTFYNDVRQPEALDYSEPVLRFCGEHNLQPPRPPLEASCEACWRPLSFQQQGAVLNSHFHNAAQEEAPQGRNIRVASLSALNSNMYEMSCLTCYHAGDE